ncbi:MAG: hypothetical protein M3512_05220, partial [Bacteroidota bacterium]|nr:hypothetical protein [Bacteroidota bacterium]
RYVPQDLFEEYLNFLGYSNSEGTFHYVKRGPLMTDFPKPSMRFNVLNKDKANFSMTTTGDYDVAEISMFQYILEEKTKIYSWDFNVPQSSKFDIVIPAIPTAITNAHSFVISDNFPIRHIYLTDYHDAISYDDIFKMKFKFDRNVNIQNRSTYRNDASIENGRYSSSKEEIEILHKIRASEKY